MRLKWPEVVGVQPLTGRR